MLEKTKFSLILSFASLVSFLGGTIYISALPELSQVFEVSSFSVNSTLTFYFVGFVVGAILSGPLSEVYGRKAILIIFLLLYSFATLLCGFSDSITVFNCGRFLEGVGSAGGPIIAIALIADRYEGREYHKIVSYILIMGGLGAGGAPIFGSVILHFFDWRIIFYVLTGLAVVATILIFFVKVSERLELPKAKETFLELRFFAKNGSFRYYFIMIGALHGALYSFVVISPYIFRLHYGWSVLDFVWVGVALTLGEAIGFALDKVLIERVEGRIILLTGLFIILTTLLMIAVFELPPEGIWLLAMITPFTVGANLTSSFLTLLSIKLDPRFTGLGSSLINLSKMSFACFALVIVPFLPETLEVVGLFILGAFLICFLGYFRVRQQI